MGRIWGGLVTWFQGKKTILGGVLIVAAGVAGVWYGKIDPVTGLGVVGFGLSVAGSAAKANRHQAQLLTALEGVAKVASDTRSGNSAAAIRDAENTATQVGLSLVPPVQSSAEGGPAK